MFERAWKYLSVHDQGRDTAVDSAILDHPLYFDDLGVTYLQEAGCFEAHAVVDSTFTSTPLRGKMCGALIDMTGEGEILAAGSQWYSGNSP